MKITILLFAIMFLSVNVMASPIILEKGNLILPNNLSVDEDTLFVDVNNAKVGIGTNTPNNKLNVVGTSNLNGGVIIGDSGTLTTGTSQLEVYNNGAQAGLMIHEDAGTSNAILRFRWGAADWEIGNFGDSVMQWQIENNPVLYMPSDGDLGLGKIPDSGYELDIKADASSNADFKLESGSGTVGQINVVDSGRTQIIADNDLVLQNNGNNVAIGRSSAKSRLEVYQGSQWSSYNYGNNILITGSRNNAIGIESSAGDKPFAIANTGAGDSLTVSAKPEIGNTTSPPTSIMTFLRAGSVGIGTITPSGKLDVDGAIYVGNEGIYDRDDGMVNIKEDLYVEGGNVRISTGSNHSKYCMWGTDDRYCMGMYSAQTLGYLNNYAMTFTMLNYPYDGFLWRDNADSSSDGAMSLTTDGKLFVKDVIKQNGCRTGFTHIGSGCLQTAEYGDSGANYATEQCHDIFNGRLPTMQEMKIGMGNYALSSETDDDEWVADIVEAGSCTYYDADGGSPEVLQSVGTALCNTTVAYRCFIPFGGG